MKPGGNHLKDQTARVCPRCGSTHIHGAKNCTGGWDVPTDYTCKDCDYSGKVFVEVDAELIEQIQKVINAS